MQVYMDLVLLLNFGVDWLLILGTNRLCGYPLHPGRAAMAAGVGSGYAALCLIPGFQFLGGFFWRMVSLVLMALIAFGCNGGTLRRGTLFVLLSMALGGVALGIGSDSFGAVIACAAAVAAMCIVGFRGRAGGKPWVDVRILYRGHERKLRALQDTGNSLRDPISGRKVLVVSGDIAREMLGLSVSELSNPVETMERSGIEGLRLIPYKAVGQPGGMLLAIKPDELYIGTEKREDLVAFAPQKIGKGEAFEALAGGII